MRDAVAIVAPAVDVAQIERQIQAEVIALQDGERKESSLSEANGKRRVAIGRLLIVAKEAGKHGTWLPRLERLGIAQRTANHWMTLAGHVEEQSKLATVANDDSVPVPTYADAGIDKRPRKTDEQLDTADPVEDWKREVASRSVDVDRELSRWHQKVVAFAEVCPARARKQIAHELRQMANTVESIED